MKQFKEKTKVEFSLETIQHMMKVFNKTKDEVIDHIIELHKESMTFENDEYKVVCRKQETELGNMLWLSICRLDREPIHSWRDLQTIKNMIIGEEIFAYEIYPAESQLVDTANQYHLWCFPNGERLPFGFNEGRKVCYESTSTITQQSIN